MRVRVGIVTAASQDWGLGFGPATYGCRPQTLNPDPGERAMEHGGGCGLMFNEWHSMANEFHYSS